jgi:hypothetical protein
MVGLEVPDVQAQGFYGSRKTQLQCHIYDFLGILAGLYTACCLLVAAQMATEGRKLLDLGRANPLISFGLTVGRTGGFGHLG